MCEFQKLQIVEPGPWAGFHKVFNIIDFVCVFL